MDCYLTEQDRKDGFLCRGMNCQPCNDIRKAALKMQNEAKHHVDIDMVSFVSRGKIVVLQTSQDYFEKMSDKIKIENIDFMIKSLNMLKKQIEESV